MTYSNQTDDVVTALRAIAAGPVVDALAPSFGAEYPAIRRTYGYPIPLAQLGSMELPGLSIYVAEETAMPQGRHRDWRLGVVLEYVGPVTALSDLDRTWPILRKVWLATVKAIEEGTVASVDVLRLLGVKWVADESASVVYETAPGGEGAFPYFIGRLWLQHRPTEFDPSTLPELTTLYANLDLYEGGAKTVDNLVTVRGTTT